jgi:molecular chaperone IbpA
MASMLNPHQWEKDSYPDYKKAITKPVTIDMLFPNFTRWAIGFDPILDIFNDLGATAGKVTSYPPYNIIKVDDTHHLIEMAVAGFSKDDIEVSVQELELTVVGKTTTKEADGKVVHRGISSRAWEQRFALAEYTVINGAKLENGMLTIELEQQLPEEKQPKIITIQ